MAKLQIFHRLLATNHISSIRWLCEIFPEIVEKKNEESLTALHVAVIENNVNALKILLEFKANLEAVSSGGHTALHFAVGKSRLYTSVSKVLAMDRLLVYTQVYGS